MELSFQWHYFGSEWKFYAAAFCQDNPRRQGGVWRRKIFHRLRGGFRIAFPGLKKLILFITGTDTGIGKTVLASAIVAHLRRKGLAVGALKPVCSGDREDARAIFTALDGALSLDEINPWHFEKPIAPVLAARAENRRLKLAEVVTHARDIQKRFPLLIIEGAGGLLSPLGEDFDSRDLIKALRAVPVVVCPNRLGAVNQTLLVLSALPRGLAGQAQVVLMAQRKPDAACEGNGRLLAEMIGRKRIHFLPWLKRGFSDPRAASALDLLVRAAGF